MAHNGSLRTKPKSISKLSNDGNTIHRMKARLRRLVLVSSENPRASKYCRSERELREEKQRQLNSKYPWVIHPLSKFRAWYEMYLILLFVGSLWLKPVDGGFARTKEILFPGYRMLSLTFDALCWLDIFCHFWTGYPTKMARRIELQPGQIARHYMRSPFFILDVLSSIPRNLPYLFVVLPNRTFLGIVNVLCFLKFPRIFSVIKLINSTAQYYEIRSRGVIFIITSTLVTFLVVHWLSCLQFLIPRLTENFFYHVERSRRQSWMYKRGITEEKWSVRYAHCFFKGSAEILGLQLPMYELTIEEDYIVSMFTYVVGRIVLAAIYIVLAMTFLTARFMQVKYLEIMNQVEEYMTQKQLPMDLRKRISQFYHFKYQNRYFNDAIIYNMLSSQLKKEINIHLCRSLIASVSVLSDLSMEEAGDVVTKLISEIFLPKDTVISSGTTSDALYFISTGTVALYTQSGQEICHLQDGGYFGEICLLMKNYLSQVTVVAIETTHIYKLKKIDFEHCFHKRKDIYHKIMREAENRRKKIANMEEEYKHEMMKRALAQASSRSLLESMSHIILQD